MNWLELAVQANQLPDSVFAFDLRNQSTSTYFYAGKASFPTADAYATLNWEKLVKHVLSRYWTV